ncbi:hypothetical protein BYT27DRAFT_7250387 [Phlegmacium glaucopus]|nr:hypothetical protein BYT27DRAFT_7250387 [Phlegmacium glaucopus]
MKNLNEFDGPQSSIDPSNIFSRTYGNLKDYQVHAAAAAHHTPIANDPGHNSAPPTAHRSTGHLRKDQSSCSPHTLISVQLELKQLNAQGVARVCNAIARDDLSQKKIKVPVQGVMVQLGIFILASIYPCPKPSLNGQFRIICKGSHSNLGEQALVLDVEGIWRELTAVVNKLAVNLTSQSHWEISMDARGEILDLKDTVNGMVARLRALAAEVTRVTLQLGSQGKLGGRAHVPDVEGAYALEFGSERMCSVLHQGLNENLSSYKSIECLPTDQLRSNAVVTTAVVRGDLTQKIDISVEGLFQLSCFEGSVNSMVDQLSAFALEVTRVALEVGRQGILGGQARVEGVQGTWAEFTRNVSKMASNLADQVAFVNVDVQGEMLDLKMTVNSMAAQLSTSANKMFRERGRSLLITVNLMAMNLTNQVRSTAEVTKTVAGGDLKTMSVERSWNGKTRDVGTEGGW